MKRLPLCLYFIFSAAVFAQNKPYAVWEDQANALYRFVRLDASTGAMSYVSVLPVINGIVGGGVSCINPDSNYYHFAAISNTNTFLYTLDIGTGNVVYNPQMTATVVGVEYNCADSMLYAIRVVGNTYYFVTLNPVDASTSVIAPVSSMTGYVGGSFSLDLSRQHYNFIASTPSGFKLRSLDLATGAVVYDNPFPDNVAGHRYSVPDSAVYGLWEDNNQYKLEKINCVNGTHSTVGVMAGVSPGFVFESQSINTNGEYTFRGFSGSNFALFTVDVSNAAILNNSLTTDNASAFEEPPCVVSPSSLEEHSTVLSFAVYPNPASGNVSLLLPDACDRIEISTVSGQLVYTRERDEGGGIDLSFLSPGAYFIRVSSATGSAYRKLVIY